MLVINDRVVEFCSMDVNGEISPRLQGSKSPPRLISFFELLWAYIGVILWTPNRLDNKDIIWLAIPSVADNLGNDFILRNHYTTARPTSWMLLELAVRSLTTNAAIVSQRTQGDSRNGLFGQAI